MKTLVTLCRVTLLSVALCAAMPPAIASISYQIADSTLAARLNGAPVQAFSVDVTWRLAHLKEPNATRTASLESIVINRLLADAARKQYGSDFLTHEQVGFLREVALDDQLVGVLRNLYEKELALALKNIPGANLDGLISEKPALDERTLDEVCGKASQGTLTLELALNPTQLEYAKKVVVLRFALPNGPSETITLYDVYQRQNVQGRVAILGRETDFILQQAKLKLATLFVLHWGKQQFGAMAVEDMRHVLSDQSNVLDVQAMHGIGDDIHSKSDLLKRLARQVTQAQINAYYRQHREDFRHVTRVKARHIRVADEQTGRAATAALASGIDFSAVARRYSIAADAATGGQLGWIRRSADPQWMEQLVFLQTQGTASRAIRTPGSATENPPYEIVLVDKGVHDYYKPNTETVRYVARNAVARQLAVAQLDQLRTRLLRSARIEINRNLLDQPLRLLAVKP